MPAVLWSLLPSLRELRGPWLSWKPGTKYKSLSPQALPLPSKEFLGSSGGPGRTPPPHFRLAVILILTPGAQPGDDFKASKRSSLWVELTLQKDEGGGHCRPGIQSKELHSHLPQ